MPSIFSIISVTAVEILKQRAYAPELILLTVNYCIPITASALIHM
jgi:hypothetical protein